MAGNSFGQLFQITTFGESHGKAIGVVVDGCPPGLEISQEDIQKEIDRRKPGQSHLFSKRQEKDRIQILSGIFDGKTTGTPILILVFNKDIRSSDYYSLKNIFRPGSADYTYQRKYLIRDFRGGGRASGRETIGRVAAGAIAQKYLRKKEGIEFLSFVEQIGNIKANIDISDITREKIESNIVRCPEKKIAEKMIKLIETVKKEGDSLGGVIRGVIKNMPVGLGEPVFDKLSADLGKGMLSIPSVKGFEIGSGFFGATVKGSQNNDEFFVDKEGKIRTKTNNAGGVLGGISNGETICFRVAFKPVPSITKMQETINRDKKRVPIKIKGRHDVCILPRAVPIVDAMAALVIMDHYLRQRVMKI